MQGQKVPSSIMCHLKCAMANQAGAEQLQSLRLMGYFCSYDRRECSVEIGFAQQGQKLDETLIISHLHEPKISPCIHSRMRSSNILYLMHANHIHSRFITDCPFFKIHFHFYFPL